MTYKLSLSFLFFKQKTAYEISRDWSSDVCSSDLVGQRADPAEARVGKMKLRQEIELVHPAPGEEPDHGRRHQQAEQDAKRRQRRDVPRSAEPTVQNRTAGARRAWVNLHHWSCW